MSPSSYIDAGIYQKNGDGERLGYKETGGYVRILIPITSGVDRIDCNKLFVQALREREINRSLKGIKDKVFGKDN
uniref:Uncharacterized protein n=1 Tax=Vibrio tasmaniensis TaxID=212663 RepID=A0A0H3ZQP0_9VIBR|nr:hypothetical protein [Vibrio tasmaniensis]